MGSPKLKGYCQPHTQGVGPGAPLFFYQDCKTCADKLARGCVTGKEGPLPTNWKAKQVFGAGGINKEAKAQKPQPWTSSERALRRQRLETRRQQRQDAHQRIAEFLASRRKVESDE